MRKQKPPDYATPYLEDVHHQRREWERRGKEWAERNPQTVEDADEHWVNIYGLKRTEAIKRELLELSPPRATWLEVGCGAGAHMRCMQAAGWENVSGCDINHDMLAMADGLDVQYGDAIDLPYDDDSFDGVTTYGTLMAQVPERRLMKAVAECARVARHTLCFFETWQPYPHFIDYEELLPAALLWPWEAVLPNMLREHGFVLISSHLYLPTPGKTPLIALAFVRLPKLKGRRGPWTMPRIDVQ